MFHTCKITVVKRMVNRELADEYMNNPELLSACNRLRDRQEFIIHNPYEIPEGLCPSAWADIRPYILSITSGASFEFMKDEHSIIASCTDLFRPVIFKIEHIDPID